MKFHLYEFFSDKKKLKCLCATCLHALDECGKKILRQGHGHEQLRAVRSWEELLLHEAETVDRSAEGDDGGENG